MLERRFGRLAMWAQQDLTTRRLWFPDVNAIRDANGKVLVHGDADDIFYAELDTSLLAVEQEIDCEAMELVEQEEEEEESKVRVGHVLPSLIFPAVSVSAWMDAAMETSAMQMLVLILAATSPIEDVDGFAQKLHKMIPALYHLHSLITQDRTELLQNLRLLCCVLTSARNWMERALPSSSSAGMRLVDTGLCPRRACQGSIVGNLELYIPEDGVELVEVRSAIETFRELYAWREWRCWHKEPFDMSRFKELPT
ncbi:unnamed protein product, partial [Symbiodinium microadriaticum]